MPARPGPLVRIATRAAVRREIRAELGRHVSMAQVSEKMAQLSDQTIDDAAAHVGVSVPKAVAAGGVLANILQWFADHKDTILTIVELLLPLLLAL